MERTGEKKETLSLNQVSTPRVKPAKNETKAPRRELWGGVRAEFRTATHSPSCIVWAEEPPRWPWRESATAPF